MKFLVGFLAVIIASGFAYESPPHVLVAGKVRAESAAKLAKKYNMSICGTGGSMMESVEEIGIAFSVDRPLKKEEARELTVKCVEELLYDINASEELRPYLAVYPFEPRRVEMKLFIHTPSGGNVYYPNFSIVSNYKGSITYLGRNSAEENLFQYREDEIYEQARELVLGEIVK